MVHPLPHGGCGMSTHVVQAWQWSMRGVRMGAGTPYRFRTAPEGLGMPAMRTADLPWLANDGAYGAGDWLQPRVVRAALWVDGGSAAASEQLARSLVAAWAPSRTDVDLELRVADARAYLLRGRPRRCELDLSPLKYGHAAAAVEFVALDPYLHDAELQAGVVQLGDATAYPGVTPDLTFDLAFQAPGVSPGVAFAANLGTAPAYPVVTFQGPVTNPRLENRTTGATFDTDVVLSGGDTLVVDMRARTITLNGTSTLAAMAVGAAYVALEPGTNELAYRSDDPTPTASTCAITWRHTWY